MTSRNDEASGEDRLIARYFKPLATHPGALGLGDDAAFLRPPSGQDLVLTTDVLVAGVHFFADDPPKTIAQKAMRVNLSDLAAKGARPLGFLLTLGLQDATNDRWLSDFASGLKADIEAFDCPLFGGDTVRAPVAMINVAMFGAVPEGSMVRRSGAKPGDRIFVTGTIGDAALGLKVRRGELDYLPADVRDFLLSRYWLPQPRTSLAEALRRYASAAMDVSDGLIGDLAKLCDASGVAGQVDFTLFPRAHATEIAFDDDRNLADDTLNLQNVAFTGGDDYEIVCTVSPERTEAFREAAKKAEVPVRAIGHISAGKGLRVVDPLEIESTFSRRSFSHF